MSWLLAQLRNIPQPYRMVVQAIAVLALILVLFTLVSRVQSCGYDRARAKYETQIKAWATERARLEGEIAERDKQIEQLKAKEAGLIAADQAGKKIDDALAEKIEAVTQAAANEAVATDQPADCWVRADRTCAKLRSLTPPINIDCNQYKLKVCSR